MGEGGGEVREGVPEWLEEFTDNPEDTEVCDGRPYFLHFCHLFCVVLFCCERLSWPVFSHL